MSQKIDHDYYNFIVIYAGTEPGKMTMGGEKYKLFSVLK
jgi:hypothetical protein